MAIHTRSVAMLGAGSWGTAVAIHIAQHGNRVVLWDRVPDRAQMIQNSRENIQYLTGFKLPQKIFVSGDLEQTINDCDEVIIAIPSHGFDALIKKLPQNLPRVSWLTKGIDPNSHQLLSERIQRQFSNNIKMTIISGPSFATEVAKGLPTALTIAGNDKNYMKDMLKLLHHGALRVYLSDDMTGVQLAGAMKNVLAIACGISDGLAYGANTQAALITRGLAEMRRLGRAMGAEDGTFMGLAGLGDLVLTCSDNQSRNRRFGQRLGQGESIDTAEKQIGQVVEGKYNAAQVCALGAQFQVELPISEQVNEILQGNIPALEAVKNLLARPAKFEN